jgi:hypothetical protein
MSRTVLDGFTPDKRAAASVHSLPAGDVYREIEDKLMLPPDFGDYGSKNII